jgi:hypothetical protein
MLQQRRASVDQLSPPCRWRSGDLRPSTALRTSNTPALWPTSGRIKATTKRSIHYHFDTRVLHCLRMFSYARAATLTSSQPDIPAAMRSMKMDDFVASAMSSAPPVMYRQMACRSPSPFLALRPEASFPSLDFARQGKTGLHPRVRSEI